MGKTLLMVLALGLLACQEQDAERAARQEACSESVQRMHDCFPDHDSYCQGGECADSIEDCVQCNTSVDCMLDCEDMECEIFGFCFSECFYDNCNL